MKKIIAIFILLVAFEGLKAQGSMIIYSQQDIPQSSYANPANRFDGRFFIGIPALSSTDIKWSNRFRYSDAIVKSGDSLKLSFDNLLEEMKDKNYMSVSVKADLLSFGITLSDKTQFIFNVSEVASVNFSISKDMVRFIYEGNAAFENRSADFDGLGLNATHYREYGIALSHQFTDKWRVGLRAKYLYGMENIYTEKMDVQFNTDPETYALQANTDFAIRSSGIDIPEGEDESFYDYINGRNNHGFAVDLGAHYQFNDKLDISASLIDWGFISWKDHTKHYYGEGDFIYDGIEINSFTNNELNIDGETSFDLVLDSLEEELGVQEGSGRYTSPLVTKFFLGANYEIDKHSNVGFLMRNDIFQAKVRPSFSLSYSRQLISWLSVTGVYSSLNNTFDNLGVGFSVDPGPVQFYLMTDNIIGAFQPQHARNLHLRFGVNLIFGREKDGPQANVAKRKTKKSSRRIKSRNKSLQRSDF